MRRVLYQVACSLDGYIAGPNEEYDGVRRRLSLREHRIYSKSGTALLSYDVVPDVDWAARPVPT